MENLTGLFIFMEVGCIERVDVVGWIIEVLVIL